MAIIMKRSDLDDGAPPEVELDLAITRFSPPHRTTATTLSMSSPIASEVPHRRMVARNSAQLAKIFDRCLDARSALLGPLCV